MTEAEHQELIRETSSLARLAESEVSEETLEELRHLYRQIGKLIGVSPGRSIAADVL
jgi:hypothetical protein